jgi:Domain of unknown function (DUF4190)/Septum formation
MAKSALSDLSPDLPLVSLQASTPGVVHVGYRLNPPPGWPPVPDGFVPAPGWRPDPSWPAPPPGWQLWLPDDGSSTAPSAPVAAPSAPVAASPAPVAASPFASPSPVAAPSPSAYPADGITAPYGGAGPYGTGADRYQDGATQYGATQYGATQYGATWPPPSQGVSGLAIASFVLGLLGVFLLTAVLSVILGIAAMAEIRRSGQRGRGLAIAGFALSGVWVAAIVGLIVLGAVTGGSGGSNPPSGAPASSASHSPATTQASTPASVNVFSLPVGTCFDNPSGSLFSINSVTPIACTKPHNAQVFAQFNVKGTSFPGTAAMERRADNGCNARITGHLDQSKITSAMSLHFIFPRQLAWDSGQRRISCLVADSSRDLTSSLLARSSG